MSTATARGSTAPLPVVAYAVKSSHDEKESVRSQLAEIADAVRREGGREIVARFGEQRRSGFRAERGPELEAAMEAAIQLAQEHGEAELWVWISSRLARGDGTRGRRSVGLVVAQLLYENVRVRSVTDDHLVTPMLAGIASEQAHKYAADLSAHVKRGKRDAVAKGLHPGGPPRDGYRIVYEHDDAGRVVHRRFVLDPERADIWRRIFALAREGVTDSMIARHMNAAGKRTRRGGNPFDRRGIAAGLTNPFYAGRIGYMLGTDDEQIVNGTHPPICPPADFDALQRKRKGLAADDAPETNADDATATGTPATARASSGARARRREGAGRPAQNHALARLACCFHCGARMTPVTSTYVRRDGTRRRTYQCDNVHYSTGLCNAPSLDAELADAAVLAELDRLLIDFDGWRERIEAGQSDERERLTRELERAERDHAAQEARHAAVQRKWADYIAAGDDARADLVLEAVERERDALAQAERRLAATRDALASVPEQANGDALLDFANGLQAAVRGRLEAANGSMAAVNLALRELFASFTLREGEWAGVGADGAIVFGGERRAVIVQPHLRESIAHALADELAAGMFAPTDGELPALRWLSVGDRREAPSAAGAAASTASGHPALSAIPSASGRIV